MDSVPWVRCASGNVFLQNPNSGISYYFRIPIFLVIRIVFPEFLQFCFDHQLTSATCIHIWHWLRFARDRYKLASSNVLIWYHHQPESHQQSFTKFLDIETPGPIDRTPETPGSGKNSVLKSLSTKKSSLSELPSFAAFLQLWFELDHTFVIRWKKEATLSMTCDTTPWSVFRRWIAKIKWQKIVIGPNVFSSC